VSFDGFALMALKIVMSREIFDALPAISCGEIETKRSATLRKTRIGTYWYVVDQQERRKAIEIRTFVRED
jgi:hypothetical protein